MTDDLDRQILSTQRRQAEEINGSADPMPAILARVGRLRRRRRYLIGAASMATALTIVGGAVLTAQQYGPTERPEAREGDSASRPPSPTPSATRSRAPTRNDPLRRALEANPKVQWEMLGAPPQGRVLCGLNVLGSADSGRTLYLWLSCGDYIIVNGAAQERTGSGLPAVVRVSGSGTAIRVEKVQFPRQAYLDADIQRLFPPSLAPRVSTGNIHTSPSSAALLAEAAFAAEADARSAADTAAKLAEQARAAAALAAEAAAMEAEQAKAAMVHGSVQLVGGPGGTTPVGVPGTITVRDQLSGKTVRTLATDSQGHYSVALAPGRYLLSATSPKYQAGNGTCVTDATGPISAGSSLERDLVCQMR